MRVWTIERKYKGTDGPWLTVSFPHICTEDGARYSVYVWNNQAIQGFEYRLTVGVARDSCTCTTETSKHCRVHGTSMIHPKGGGPTRCTTLPEGTDRKNFPIATGLLDYFPDAIAAVSQLSAHANEQHRNSALYWDRSKSEDEADTLMRHMMQRGTLDTDGMRHTAKVAWRALALLQKEIEAEKIKR